MRRKLLTIALPKEEFLTLEELAELQERTPQQQALFLLRGVLQETTPIEERTPALPDADNAYRPPPPSFTYCNLRLEELAGRIDSLRAAQADASTSQAARISAALLIAEDEQMSIERLLRI